MIEEQQEFNVQFEKFIKENEYLVELLGKQLLEQLCRNWWLRSANFQLKNL